MAPGASLCYLLARAVGRKAAVTYFPARVQSFREKLEQNREELPFFLLFLRLFPMSPNWALNMASGVLGKNCTLFVHQIIVEVYFWIGLFLSLISYLFPGVPLHLFFLSVLFGLMPYNYLCVTSGVLLAEISSLQEVLSWANMGRTATIAAAALLPSAVRRLRGRTD